MNNGNSKAPSATPPFAFFEWMLARRYLSATRKGQGVSLISMIAFFGIMLGVAALIIVMAVMQGFRAKLLDQLLGFSGHVFVQSQSIENYESLADQISKIPTVTRAIPLIEAPVYAAAKGEVGLIVRGMRKEDLMKIDFLTGPDHIIGGSFDGYGEGKNGGNEIAIGSRTAFALGVGPGDSVTLIAGRGAETAFGPTLRNKTYIVGAIYEVGMSEIDKLFIFMPLKQAQLFFSKGDSVQSIEIMTEDPDKVDGVKELVQSFSGDYSVVDWRLTNASYFNALQIERGLVRIIMALIVLVAALNIISGLIMLVKDKTGDIAVLRTMGATRGAVMRVFITAGSLIGVFGTLAGLILGALFVQYIGAIEKGLSQLLGVRLFNPDIYFFSEVPAEIQVSETVFIVVWALLMSFLATIYPAWRAARLDPVEALRYE